MKPLSVSRAGRGVTAMRLFLTLFFGFVIVTSLLMTCMVAWFVVFPHFWNLTEAQVISVELLDREKSSNNGNFRVEVEYEYAHQGEVHRNAERHAFNEYGQAQVFADQYTPGTTANCYVNPFNGAKSTMKRSSPWLAIFLVLPLVSMGVGIAGVRWVWWGKFWKAKPPKEVMASTRAAAIQGPAWERAVLLVIFSLFLAMGLVFFAIFFVVPVLQIVEAKNWMEVPCTVISSDVRSGRNSDGDTTYRVEILYRYEVDGREYRSDRYKFGAVVSGGYSGRNRVVRQYPAGSQFVCYVDPNDPGQAVLDRDFGPGTLFGLFPLIFVGVGAGGLVYQWRTRNRPQQPLSGRSLNFRKMLATGGMRMPARVQPAGREQQKAAGASGPVVLEPKYGPWMKFIGVVLMGLFWNGIVSIFVVQVVEGWRSGHGEWFLTIFMVPFVLVGLGLIGAAFYFLLAVFNPRPKLIVSSDMVPLGGDIDVEWQLKGRVHSLHELRLSLVGMEEARYRRGTSTHTDTETFTEIELKKVTNPLHMRRGNVRLAVPSDSMHSIDTGNNKIIWAVRVHGDIRFWPDVNEKFPITVLPQAIN